MVIKYKKLDNFISAPIRAHSVDAGADLFATEDIVLNPNERYAMPLGFAIAVPEGYMATIRTKSSKFKTGLYSKEPPVDAGYTGEVHALLHNVSNDIMEIHRGDKVAQLIVVPVILAEFEEVESLEKTERGDGAFGSTGLTLEK